MRILIIFLIFVVSTLNGCNINQSKCDDDYYGDLCYGGISYNKHAKYKDYFVYQVNRPPIVNSKKKSALGTKLHYGNNLVKTYYMDYGRNNQLLVVKDDNYYDFKDLFKDNIEALDVLKDNINLGLFVTTDDELIYDDYLYLKVYEIDEYKLFKADDIDNQYSSQSTVYYFEDDGYIYKTNNYDILAYKILKECNIYNISDANDIGLTYSDLYDLGYPFEIFNGTGKKAIKGILYKKITEYKEYEHYKYVDGEVTLIEMPYTLGSDYNYTYSINTDSLLLNRIYYNDLEYTPEELVESKIVTLEDLYELLVTLYYPIGRDKISR